MTQTKDKYRAWDGDEMREYILVKDGIAYEYMNQYECGITNHITPQPEWVLMQFTGLHDRNGKEIYEGDVVRIENYTRGSVCACRNCENIFEIRHIRYTYVFNNPCTNLPFTDYNTHTLTPWEIVVIGNIHESYWTTTLTPTSSTPPSKE